MSTLRCDCGDSACPSCGRAQGTVCTTCDGDGVIEKDQQVPGEGWRAVLVPCPDCTEEM